MADPKDTSVVDADLLFIVDNCVTQNPDLHPDKFYMELLSGTERTLNLPSQDDIMRINLKD